MSKGEYPELEKVEQLMERSQPAGEFLDWLVNERKIVLAQYHKHTEDCYTDALYGNKRKIFCCSEDLLMPCHIGIEKLLAEYFHIDLEKVEQERHQLLEDMRKMGEKK